MPSASRRRRLPTFTRPISGVSFLPPLRISAEFCARTVSLPPRMNIFSPMLASRVSAWTLRASTRAPWRMFLSMVLPLVARFTSRCGNWARMVSICTLRSLAVRSALIWAVPMCTMSSCESRALALSVASMLPLASIPSVKAWARESARARMRPLTASAGSLPSKSWALPLSLRWAP